MPDRFEQSAPPSIDSLYRTLPVGPFGASPFIRPSRGRRAAAGRKIRGGLGSWISGFKQALGSMLGQVARGAGAGAMLMPPTRGARHQSCP